MSLGKIHPKDALFMKVGHGGATSSSGKQYELNATLGGCPMISSKQTGKQWVLSWEELIRMAIDAGIDQEVS